MFEISNYTNISSKPCGGFSRVQSISRRLDLRPEILIWDSDTRVRFARGIKSSSGGLDEAASFVEERATFDTSSMRGRSASSAARDLLEPFADLFAFRTTVINDNNHRSCGAAALPPTRGKTAGKNVP